MTDFWKAHLVELAVFQVEQNFVGAFQDFRRKARQASDLNAVAFVSGPGNDFSEKEDLVVPFLDLYGEIFNSGQNRVQFGQFVVMGGKQSFRAGISLSMQMLDDGPGDADSVKGAGASADFIENDQAFFEWRC